jgi:hypothetical protein
MTWSVTLAQQPYDLGFWYSAPMNAGGEAQVETLHRLSRETIP